MPKFEVPSLASGVVLVKYSNSKFLPVALGWSSRNAKILDCFPWLWGSPDKMSNCEVFPLGSDYGPHGMLELEMSTTPRASPNSAPTSYIN